MGLNDSSEVPTLAARDACRNVSTILFAWLYASAVMLILYEYSGWQPLGEAAKRFGVYALTGGDVAFLPTLLAFLAALLGAECAQPDESSGVYRLKVFAYLSTVAYGLENLAAREAAYLLPILALPAMYPVFKVTAGSGGEAWFLGVTLFFAGLLALAVKPPVLAYVGFAYAFVAVASQRWRELLRSDASLLGKGSALLLLAVPAFAASASAYEAALGWNTYLDVPLLVLVASLTVFAALRVLLEGSSAGVVAPVVSSAAAYAALEVFRGTAVSVVALPVTVLLAATYVYRLLPRRDDYAATGIALMTAYMSLVEPLSYVFGKSPCYACTAVAAPAIAAGPLTTVGVLRVLLLPPGKAEPERKQPLLEAWSPAAVAVQRGAKRGAVTPVRGAGYARPRRRRPVDFDGLAASYYREAQKYMELAYEMRRRGLLDQSMFYAEQSVEFLVDALALKVKRIVPSEIEDFRKHRLFSMMLFLVEGDAVPRKVEECLHFLSKSYTRRYKLESAVTWDEADRAVECMERAWEYAMRKFAEPLRELREKSAGEGKTG
ncbi:HEPN domain-containing protein [Thermofilum pendens]|uniref:HEPN domain protein n=1 Tax=Thermofilum pendens (strain DSM 2475 / Hrk 5) TaxID=368408 RepID=A1S0U7_THEPD|nr:HEPN domain-containing protein [Thermofilum pendens]ABL79077.1 HEPN domain protein [Thermofilum pendens Hrk 5]